MNNNTDKLNRFKNAVFSDADKKIQAETENAEKQRDERLEKAKLEAESFVNVHNAEADKQAAAKSIKEISAQKLETGRNVLRRRSELEKDVFDKVYAELEKFRSGEDYKRLLLKRAQKCAAESKQNNGKLFISPKDMCYANELALGGKFEVLPKESIELGGVLAVYEDVNLAYDCTFDSAFEDEKNGFTKKAELRQ